MTLQALTHPQDETKQLLEQIESARRQGDLQGVADLLALIAGQLGVANQLQTRLNPEPAVYATFPAAGGFQPIAAGITNFTFRKGLASTPSGGTASISSDIQFMKSVQSAYIVADSPVSVQTFPGVGILQLGLNTPLVVEGRTIEQIQLNATYPFNLFIILSNSTSAPSTRGTVWAQVRTADMTITKGSGANVADSWTKTIFVPQYGALSLPQANGSQFLVLIGCGQKVFLIRNLSTSTLEFRIRGAVVDSIAQSLNAVTTTQDLVLDPDVHVAGTQTANLVSVATLTPALLETSIQYGYMVLEARVTASVAAGTTARYVTEFSGQSFAVR